MLDRINIDIFKAINNFAGRSIFLDKFGIILAQYLFIVFILFLIYLWFNDHKRKEIALFSGYTAIIGILSNYLITLFYFHPRPFMDKIGTVLVKHAPDTSFPSDHTTFMLSIAFMLLYFKKTRNAGIVFVFLGILGGIARVFCGLHFPLDVAGSILVAFISSYIIFISKNKLQGFNHFIINMYYKVMKRSQIKRRM